MYQYIGPSINLFIGGSIIYYLNHLEKIGCKCSLKYQRNYIFYYTISLFIINFISLFFQDRLKQYALIVLPFSMLLLIAGIMNIIYTIEFVEDMKKQNCTCSESIVRELMFVLAILQIAVYVLFFTLIIYIFTLRSNANISKSLNSLKIKKIKK
jgi:hypothetical protein